MEETINRTVLPNGIRVISQKVPAFYSVAIGFWLRTGSNDEEERENGLAHLLEHMTFKGTTQRSNFAIAHDIESLGGVINAFTSRNATCYYVHLLHEHVEKGVEVLADIIQHPVFDREELDKEKRVIIEEIREIEDDPGSVVHDLFDQQVFPDHPLGRPIQGTIATVSSFTRDDLVNFMQHHYTNDRLIVVAVGNIDHSRLVEIVERYCCELPAKSPKRHEPGLPPIKKRNEVHYRAISQAHLVLGRRIFPRTDPRRIHLSLLHIILSGGMSSRLFHNIRNRHGDVYDIYSFSDLFTESGIFGIYAGVAPQQLEKMRELIYQELAELSKNGLTESELQKVKEQAKGSLVISLESLYSRMTRLANSAIFEKGPLTIQGVLERISKVTLNDIHALAAYLYQPDEFVETIIIPEEKAKTVKKNRKVTAS